MHFSTILGAAALIAPVLAQTFTDCNPMNVTCPNDPALGTTNTFLFNTSRIVTDSFNITAGSLAYTSDAAQFTVAKQKDSPTIQSHFYIFFGSVSVVMKAAAGQGIISSIVLESDDLDEIDWEFMGGNTTHAETNYFGKGNQTSFDRAVYYPVSSNVQENWHNYTVDWTSERIEWIIDGAVVRTLLFADANGGSNFPQTPMTVRLGIWSGGDEDNNSKGTVEWAGGATDFSKAPFNMYVQSATVQDYSTGKEYEWTDKSGSFGSIKAIQGNSTAAVTITKTAEEIANPEKSLSEKFAALPSTTKLAIYAGAGGVGAILLAAFIFTCCRSRRAGKKERIAYNASVEAQREQAYKDQLELREKGLGGWDAHSTQGDDALGGWGGTHVAPGEKGVPELPKGMAAASVNSDPSRGINRMDSTNSFGNMDRSASPAISHSGVSRMDSYSQPSVNRMDSYSQPTLNRMDTMNSRTASPGPLLSPVSQHSQTWNGGNDGGMIHNAQNSYNGGYGGNQIPRSPSAQTYNQTPQQQPQPQRSFTGYSQQGGGYQRF